MPRDDLTARLGPASTPIASPSICESTSVRTWVIRFDDDTSMPLVTLTISASRASHGLARSITARMCWAGTATITMLRAGKRLFQLGGRT